MHGQTLWWALTRRDLGMVIGLLPSPLSITLPPDKATFTAVS